MSIQVKAAQRLQTQVQASFTSEAFSVLNWLCDDDATLHKGSADDDTAAGSIVHQAGMPGLVLDKSTVARLAKLFAAHPDATIEISGEGSGKLGFEVSVD
jgi:hypothetical protein